MKLLIILLVAALAGCSTLPKSDTMTPDEMGLGLRACGALGMPLLRASIARGSSSDTFVAVCSEEVSVVVIVNKLETKWSNGA